MRGLGSKWVLVGFFAFFIYSSSALARDAGATGALKLFIEAEANQRPVEDAVVYLRGRGEAQRTFQADSKGEVNIEALAAGLYDIQVQHPGFQSVRLSSVRVEARKTTVSSVTMSAVSAAIEETVVTGQRVSSGLLNSVGASRIEREALRSAAGSGGDVLRALDGLPGLFGDSQFSTFTVRGNGPRDNLILVDGIPFADVVHFSESFGDQEDLEGGGRYSVFAPNLIADASFYPGGWEAAYGGKSGSLLKLNVAEGNLDTPYTTLRLDIAGWEAGYEGPSRILDNTSLLLSARQYDFSRIFDLVGAEDIGTPELTDVILKTTSRWGTDTQFNLLMIHAPETYSRNVENVLASDNEEPGNFEDVSLARIEKDNDLLAATLTNLIGNRSRIENRWYVRYLDEQSRQGEAYPDLVPIGTPAEQIPLRPDILDSLRTEQETAWRFDFYSVNPIGEYSAGWRVEYWDVDYGLQLNEPWIRYTYDQNDYRENEDQRYIELTPESLNNQYQDSAVNYTVYVDQQGEAGPVDFRLGVRGRRDNFSEQTLLAPRAGASLAAGLRGRLTLTVGRYFQAPSFSDRAYDQNNSRLKNEVFDQISVGYEYLSDSGVTVFLEPYYQEMTDLIIEQDGVNEVYANTGSGRSYGVDMALRRELLDGWSADIKYSYNHATVRERSDEASIPADFNRPHIFSIGGVWELSEKWKVSGRWKWASGRPYNDAVVYADVLPEGYPLRYSKEETRRNTERYASYQSLNVRVDYWQRIGRTNVIAFLDIINLLGSENPNNTQFNERTGEDVVSDGSAFPLFGFRLEW